MEPLDREYEYKPRWSHILLAGSLSGGLAAIVAALGHWTHAIFVSLVAIANWGFLVVRRLFRPQRIVFTSTAVILPKSHWSSAEITVPYMAITDLSVSHFIGQRLLTTSHAGGKTTISSWCLPTDEHFEQVRYLLEELVKAQRAKATVYSNPHVRQAIARLSESPSAENRQSLYAAITQGSLLLVVRHPIPGIGSTPVRIEHDIPADVLTTSSPDGGKALVAFTDLESVSGRLSAAERAVIVVEARTVLDLVVRNNDDGLIVNPNGPWAGIPREDVLTILAATDNRAN